MLSGTSASRAPWEGGTAEAVQDLLGTEVTQAIRAMQGEADRPPASSAASSTASSAAFARDASRGDAVEFARRWCRPCVPLLHHRLRIFQTRLPDIVREILELQGVRNNSFSLTGSTRSGLLVQYADRARFRQGTWNGRHLLLARARGRPHTM